MHDELPARKPFVERGVCASGLEGAKAAGTPAERSGARKHEVGRDAGAPKGWRKKHSGWEHG
jgi:hypothetical protein